MLDWVFRYGAWHAPAPLFGRIRVEDYGSGLWLVNYSVPGFCDTFVEGEFPSAEQAKAAAQERVALRLREFLYDDKKGR